MGDPFSVAGTAVGITSLGIQVCQGLVQYYSQYRSYHDDIDSAIQRLEGLEGILKVLDSVKSKVELDNHKLSEQLQLAMRACKAALKRLDIQHKKCRDTKIPGTLKDRANMVMKRLYWPFRKETLEDLQVTVDTLQRNLQLCLQTLDIDVAHQNFESLFTQGQELAGGNDTLQAQHVAQSRSLERIETGIGTIMSSYDEQTAILNTQLEFHSTNMSLQLESIQKSLSMLVTGEGKMRRVNQTPPSVLSETLENYRDASTTYNRSLRKYNTNKKRLERLHQMIDNPCNCRRYEAMRERDRYWSWGFLSTTYCWESEHVMKCPKFQHTGYASSLQARFTHCSRYLGFCVNIGLSYAKLKGQTVISPYLSYRAVVAEDSPGFRPFKEAEVILAARPFLFGRVNKEHWTRERVKDLCDTILREVNQSFQEGTAKPNDTQATGTTILHSACRLIGKLLSQQLVDGHNASMFLRSLINAGVPTDEREIGHNHAVTPLEIAMIFSGVDSEASQAVFEFLIESAEAWFISLSPHNTAVSPNLSRMISHLLTNSDYASVYDTSVPELDVAFVQKSLSIFRRHLDSGEWDTRKPPPWTLAYWNEGLKSYPMKHVNWSDETLQQHRILALAIACKDTWAIDHLVRNGAHVRPYDYRCAIDSFVNSDVKLRRQVLTILARALKKQELALSSGEQRWNASFGDMKDYRTLYIYIRKFDDVAVSALHSAGFCNVDDAVNLPWGPYGTPAWIHAKLPGSPNSTTNLSQLLQWFEEKGADLNWIHPSLGTTPVNMFVRRSANTAMRSSQTVGINDERTKDPFFSQALDSDRRDGCSCYCSNGGCLAVTVAMQEIIDGCNESLRSDPNLKKVPYSNAELQDRARLLFMHVCSRIDAQGSLTTYLHHAMIRVLTFDLLHLSHTCCRYDTRELGYYARDEWHDSEIREIHDIESKQIELLGYLLAQFEPKWEGYSGSFYDFVENLWKPYIEDELDKYYGNDEDEKRRFKEAGVILEDNYSEIETEDEDNEVEDNDDKDGIGIVVFGPERPPELL